MRVSLRLRFVELDEVRAKLLVTRALTEGVAEEVVAIEPTTIRVAGRPVKVFMARVRARVEGDTVVVEDEPLVEAVQ